MAFSGRIHKNNFTVTLVWRERWIERSRVPSGVPFTPLGGAQLVWVVGSRRALEEI
jgi:hypothetical protein